MRFGNFLLNNRRKSSFGSITMARGPSAAAREGERGTKMKGGGGTRNPILGKTQKVYCYFFNVMQSILSFIHSWKIEKHLIR